MLDDDVNYNKDGFEHIVIPEEKESELETSDDESEYSEARGCDSNNKADGIGGVLNDKESAEVVAAEEDGDAGNKEPSNQPRMVSELGSNLGTYWSSEGPLVNWVSFDREGNYDKGPITIDNSDRFLLAEMQKAYSGDVLTAHMSKATPQYFFHKGMKLFGKKGQATTKKEMEENLLGMDAVSMVKPDDLDKKLCKETLPYLMFLKRKRTGKVKGRGVCDGSAMRSYISRDDTISPTV